MARVAWPVEVPRGVVPAGAPAGRNRPLAASLAAAAVGVVRARCRRRAERSSGGRGRRGTGSDSDPPADRGTAARAGLRRVGIPRARHVGAPQPAPPLPPAIAKDCLAGHYRQGRRSRCSAECRGRMERSHRPGRRGWMALSRRQEALRGPARTQRRRSTRLADFSETPSTRDIRQCKTPHNNRIRLAELPSSRRQPP